MKKFTVLHYCDIFLQSYAGRTNQQLLSAKVIYFSRVQTLFIHKNMLRKIGGSTLLKLYKLYQKV